MANSRAYFPLSVQEDSLPFKVAAFDFETEGLGGKLLCATWFVEGMSEAEIILGSPAKIVNEIIKVFVNFPGVRWYAHNAQYDWRYIVDEILDRYGDSIEFLMRTDNDVFQIKTVDFELVDSFALWPHSLKTFAETFLPELPKLKIDVANFDVKNPKHIEYAKRDSEILVKALLRFDEMLFHLFGIHMGYTLAGTAVRAWRITIDRPYYNPAKIDDFVRLAYFGGAVQFSSVDLHENVFTYDVNSSYPYVMREFGVPYGAYLEVTKYFPDQPGIYRVVVESPAHLVFPILPKRVIKGESNYIIWPQGIFETSATNLELNFALENGYKILEVKSGILWNEYIFPFNGLVDFCEAARAKYKNEPLEKVVKLIQNSVYGKFGTRKERTVLFVPKCDEDYFGAYQWGASERLWIKKEDAENILALPQWAVFITANARIHLLRQIYVLGVENVLYCDTDSISTTKKMATKMVGLKYGQFKLEKIWKTFRVIAPQSLYGCFTRRDYDGSH